MDLKRVILLALCLLYGGVARAQPQISSNVPSLNFGSEVQGQVSDPQTLILSNVGNANLVVSDNEFIGANPADFGLTEDFCSFQVIVPGTSCQMGLSMRPIEIGGRSAQLVIESNDPNQPLLFIELSGNGTGSGGCGNSLNRSMPARPSDCLFLAAAFGLSLALRWRGKKISSSHRLDRVL